MMRYKSRLAVIAAVVSIGFSGISILHASECDVTPPCPVIPCPYTPTADSLPVPTHISGGALLPYFWDGTGTPPILEVPVACHNPSWPTPYPDNACGEPSTEGDMWAEHFQLIAGGTDTDKYTHKFYIQVDGCCDLRETEHVSGDTVCVKWTGTVDLTKPGYYTLTANFTNLAAVNCPMTVVDTKTVDLTVQVKDCSCTADRLPVSDPNPDIRSPQGSEFIKQLGEFQYFRELQTYTKTECMKDTGNQSAKVCGGTSILGKTEGWNFGGSIPISAKVKGVFSLGFTFTAGYTKSWTFSGTATPEHPAIWAKVKAYQKYVTLEESWQEAKYQILPNGMAKYIGSTPVYHYYGPLKMEDFCYIKIMGCTNSECLPEGDMCIQ